MRMNTKGFNKMTELRDFVNREAIDQENIVNIFQSKDGLFVLVYYVDE